MLEQLGILFMYFGKGMVILVGSPIFWFFGGVVITVYVFLEIRDAILESRWYWYRQVNKRYQQNFLRSIEYLNYLDKKRRITHKRKRYPF